jgi:hypothetical protein
MAEDFLLSPRETQVIAHYAVGLSGSAIGVKLGIRAKIGANNLVHAAVIWSRRGP